MPGGSKNVTHLKQTCSLSQLGPLWRTTEIFLGTLYFKLHMLCAAVLYSPE